MASSLSSPRPLRIACLHGFLQNAKLFRQKTGGLRKSLQRDIASIRGESAKNRNGPRQPLAELYYLDAPFILERIDQDMTVDHTTEQKGRSCFRLVYSPTTSSRGGENVDSELDADATERSWLKIEGRTYIGWERSLEYLQNEFAEKKFDGILGFSQGAVVASIICPLRGSSSTNNPFDSLHFAICISGFPSGAEAHENLYTQAINIPSLHIWGLHDEMVANPGSKRLRDKFQEQGREVIEHSGGHIVPNDAESRRRICEFVLRFAHDGGARAAAL